MPEDVPQGPPPIVKRPCSWDTQPVMTSVGAGVLLTLSTPETDFRVILLAEGATRLADSLAKAAGAKGHLILPTLN